MFAVWIHTIKYPRKNFLPESLFYTVFICFATGNIFMPKWQHFQASRFTSRRCARQEFKSSLTLLQLIYLFLVAKKFSSPFCNLTLKNQSRLEKSIGIRNACSAAVLVALVSVKRFLCIMGPYLL